MTCLLLSPHLLLSLLKAQKMSIFLNFICGRKSLYSINSDKTDETVEILQKANNNDSIALTKMKKL